MLLCPFFTKTFKKKEFVLDYQQVLHYRIQKAWETYDDAKCLVDSNRFSSILNRTYYACFYMVIALLLTKNISSSKHSGVKSLFSKHFVNQGILEKKWGSFYSGLFLYRQISDYEDLKNISQETIVTNFKLAFEFLTMLE